jgi:catechol 2,3-dioxygenase-like lactoylglutathione lyase family enzyme
MRYLHTMIRVADPAASTRFFNLLGLTEPVGWRAPPGASR